MNKEIFVSLINGLTETFPIKKFFHSFSILNFPMTREAINILKNNVDPCHYIELFYYIENGHLLHKNISTPEELYDYFF